METTTTTTTTTHTINADLLEDRGYATTAKVAFIFPGIPNCRSTYTLGFSPEGQLARRVFEGPLVSDLFGWFNAEPIVIAAHGIVDPRPVLAVAVGDTITVEGHGVFTVLAPTRFGYHPRVEVASV